MRTVEGREQWRARAVRMKRLAQLSWLVAAVALLAGILLSRTAEPVRYFAGAVVLTGWILGFILMEQARRAEFMTLADEDPDDID